ncbi:MAG: hypothetical protein LQ343_004385 [Gyalolechia ehrenbergii]|nr:MAG: hypothetical protein LQ343_004385 [Gyalolechia ehrenbergii]
MAADASPSQLSLTHILQSNIDDLRNLWFDRDHSKKTCPDCRAHVVHQPAPAYLVREITQSFINTAALLPPGENTEDHRKFQRDEAEIVERDRANQSPDGGLFNGRFKPLLRQRAPIRDAADGVIRCPTCAWELEDGMCNSCGYILGLDAFSYHDEDEDFNSDAQSFSSLELEEILADHPDYLDYDSTGSGNYRSHRRHMDHVRRRAGLPPQRPLNRHNRPRLASASPVYGSSEDDYLSDEYGSPTSSIRNFMIDDMAVDDGANPHSDDSEDSSDYGSGLRGSDSERSHPSEEPSDLHSDNGSDTTLVTTARQRSRGRRIATSSPETSDSDASHFTRSSRLSSNHDGQDHGSGGFSPLQPYLDDHNSQDVPIQIDSDSDAPPIRCARKRLTAVPVSSDEEDNDARGVAIQPLPSGMASNSGSANSGNRSQSLGSPGRSRQEASITSNSAPSPILIGSSPGGPGSPRRDLLSNMPSPPTAPYRQQTPSVVPRHSRRSSTREQSERRRSRSLSGRLPPSPRQMLEQRRENRKRIKRQTRQRRQQERQSRGRVDPLGQPQQLAYIGV